MARRQGTKKKTSRRGKSKRAKQAPKKDAAFIRQVARAKTLLSKGKVLSIDPSSGGTSMPGWALFRGGAYVSSGTLEVTGTTIAERLADLQHKLSDKRRFKDIDVLVIERIRGRVHVYLTWSVGATVCMFPDAGMVEVPVMAWKKYIKDDLVYEKSDAADATAIGCAAIAQARELMA